MNGVRYKDNHVNYSFEAAVGIAYKALGKEWDKIDYIREYYQSYCFENVGSGYTSAMVPLFVSKNTGECYGLKEQKERWKKGDVPDDAMSIMNSDLPLPRVHFGGKYFGFSETEEFECYFCSCHKKAIENEIALFVRYYQYDCALNDRMQLLLTYTMELPDIAEEAIKGSKLPIGPELYELFEYKDNICHLCNGINPKIHYGMFAKGSKFKQQYGQYLHVKFNGYGIGDILPQHFGIYFLEEVLPEEFKIILIPSMEEVLSDIKELNSFDDNSMVSVGQEIEKIWSMSQEERYVLMYDQQKSRILRDANVVTPYQFAKGKGINTDIVEMLQDAIWKRFKKIDKMITDEVKAQAKGAK